MFKLKGDTTSHKNPKSQIHDPTSVHSAQRFYFLAVYLLTQSTKETTVLQESIKAETKTLILSHQSYRKTEGLSVVTTLHVILHVVLQIVFHHQKHEPKTPPN